MDKLIFTGGIGENAAAVRAEICAELDFLGMRIDPKGNADHAAIISEAGTGVRIRVIRTNEDIMMARHARIVLQCPAG